MFYSRFIVVFLYLTIAVKAQQSASSLDVANLREDLHGLSDKINDLTLKVEQLESENAQLKKSLSGPSQNYVTQNQLNDVISELKLAIQASSQSTKDEIINKATAQLETAAIKKVVISPDASSSQSSKSNTGGSFSSDFPKEGISYIVQKGDTLALIAKKTSAKTRDIINANKISDPSRIYVGQTLFIPGAK
jgi:nucleoid-associated protein YgaU